MDRFCAMHGHECQFCNATNRQGGPCGWHVALDGKVCRFHGGRTPVIRAATERRRKARTAAELVAALGVPIETSPEEALLGQVWEAAGNVVVLRGLVQVLSLESGGIYGPSSKPNEAEPHVLVRLYAEERDRLARMAKACADAGISERLVKIAEDQAALVVRAVTEALDDPEWSLSPELQALGRQVIGRHLTLIR